MEFTLDCCNDDCKEQIKRKHFEQHIHNDCEFRMVPCKYKLYGCDVEQIQFNQMQHHLETYKLDHLSLQFTFMTNQV